MKITDVFADNVRTYRRHAGITQEELAEAAGLHRSYIGRIEQKRENPTIGSADKIAQALGVDLPLFFLEPDNAKQEDSQGRTVADYELGDCALCTWTEDGIHFDPLVTDDPDQTLRMLSAMAEGTGDALDEAFLKVKEKRIARRYDESDNRWLSDQFD